MYETLVSLLAIVFGFSHVSSLDMMVTCRVGRILDCMNDPCSHFLKLLSIVSNQALGKEVGDGSQD